MIGVLRLFLATFNDFVIKFLTVLVVFDVLAKCCVGVVNIGVVKLSRNLAENLKKIASKPADETAEQPEISRETVVKPSIVADSSEMSSSNAAPMLKDRGRLLTLATNFIAGMGLLAFLGYQLDSYMKTNHYLYTLLGLALGFIWGFYEIIKFALRTQNQTNNPPSQNNIPAKSISHENSPPKKQQP
ncbi:hypothetical protein COTS27_01356 [Spirochaetota bacterium]|nr:hypothetical protein COTS27_01356 [Spirochaetota bacterium]